jgi:hypothetical protein
MEEEVMEQITFNGIPLNVVPTGDTRQWWMDLEQTAEAYGVTPNAVQQTIGRHSGEIREDLEKGVTICHTPGGPQQKVILYREGVIKLGFFMRGERAIAFRQFATDLIVQHLKDTNQDSPDGVMKFLNDWRLEVNNKLDNLSGIQETVFGDDAEEIRELIELAAKTFKVSQREYWGHIRKECDVSSYKQQNRKIKNFIRNELGMGLKLLKPATIK